MRDITACVIYNVVLHSINVINFHLIIVTFANSDLHI